MTTMTTMTADTCDQVRKRLADWVAQPGRKQSMIASQTGYSASAVSQFLSGNYQIGGGEIVTAVSQWLDREDARISAASADGMPPAGWLETTVARRITSQLERSHRKRTFGMITGDAGVGKTITLEHYAKHNRAAVLVRADMTADRPAYLLAEIGDVLGIRVPANLFEAQRRVRDALKDTDRLLIIDEAQRLSGRSVEGVRDLIDRCKIGVVLVGNDAIQAQVYGSGQAAFAQHSSRLANALHVANTDLSAEDLDLLTGGLLLADPSARKWLHDRARGQGGFRTALMTLDFALELRARDSGLGLLASLRNAHALRGMEE